MTRPTVRAAMMAATQRLAAKGVPDPARDVRRLFNEAMEHAAPAGDEAIPDGVAMRFEAMISARERRKPVSHILGYREFWGRRFYVNEHVLDPRPETECLIEIALQEPFCRVLDLGTGSGAILWTLLGERPTATGVGTDLSADALDVARANPLLDDFSARGSFVQSDWFANVQGTFDLIVSNPPYIAAAEMAGLSPEVRDYEPNMALTDGADGLAAYRAIAAQAMAHMADNARLLVEIGPTQGGAVAAMFTKAGLQDVVIHPDLDGRDRVVLGRCRGNKTG